MAFYLIGPFMGYGTEDGTVAGAGDRAGLGHLRRHLLRRSSKVKGRTTLVSASRRDAGIPGRSSDAGLKGLGRAVDARPRFFRATP